MVIHFIHSQGWAVKCTSELGGLGPDSQLRYGKQQVDFQGILPLGMGAALSLSASGGEGHDST